MNWFGKLFGGMFGNGFNAFGFNSVRFMNPVASFNNYADDKLKIQAVFTHPAVLKVFALNCDIASLGEIYVYGKDGVEIKDHALLDRFEAANPFQTKQQFLWDYCFWNMIGNAYLYTVDRGDSSEYTRQYFLDSSKMEWPLEIQKNCDKLVLSKAMENEMLNQQITYRYNDGTSIKIKLKDISIFSDLSNGVGNWFKSPSRLDALYKVISNSEAALDSTNINIRFAGKYLVAGTSDPNDVTQTPLTNTEKKDMETKIYGDKPVHALKSMIDVKRFVENIANLKLDESYFNAYYIIGSMYGIPRDLLEAYLKDGSKFNNQAVALSRHIAYTLMPKMENLANNRTKKLGLKEKGEKLVISYDHLAVMQSDEKETAETRRITSETIRNLQDSGATTEEINTFLDTNFKNLTPRSNDSK